MSRKGALSVGPEALAAALKKYTLAGLEAKRERAHPSAGLCPDCGSPWEFDFFGPMRCPSCEEKRWHRDCVLCGERFRVEDCRMGVCRACPKCDTAGLMAQRERARVGLQNKRAADLGLDASLTLEEWIEILKASAFGCSYCGKPFAHMDHVIPISKGGGTTKENVTPACERCNLSKGARPLAPTPRRRLPHPRPRLAQVALQRQRSL